MRTSGASYGIEGEAPTRSRGGIAQERSENALTKLVGENGASAAADDDHRGIRRGALGITLEHPDGMLVEGGYLHSMKRMLERAAETPDPTPRPGMPPTRPGALRALVQALKRLLNKTVES